MSAFEFVLVALAILIGFGISAILEGLGDLIRTRRRVRPYPLQLAASAYVLWFSLQYLWILWLGRELEAWNFLLYLGLAVPALSIALAAHILKTDTSPGAPSARDQYFENSGPAYLTLALFPLSALGMSFTGLRDMVPDPPNLVAVSIVRLGIAGLFVFMAWSKSERVHWVGLGVVWLFAVGFVLRLATRL